MILKMSERLRVTREELCGEMTARASIKYSGEEIPSPSAFEIHSLLQTTKKTSSRHNYESVQTLPSHSLILLRLRSSSPAIKSHSPREGGHLNDPEAVCVHHDIGHRTIRHLEGRITDSKVGGKFNKITKS